MAPLRTITFASGHRDFVSTLNSRVNGYFRGKGISKHANKEMIIKTIVMFLMYFGPYTLIVSGLITAWPLQIGLVVVMSLGLAGIGLSVMHDANHGAYSRKKWVNQLAGYSLNLVGANSFNWKMQHNVLHHTFTNVLEEDEDISPRGAFRLTPHSDWKKIHQYQHIYAWPLYGFMTLLWLGFSDFRRIIKYGKTGLAKKNNAHIGTEWTILIATKMLYSGYIFVIPLLLTSLLWWQILMGIFVMHYIAGMLLALIFQPAHVIEGADFPVADENLALPNAWAVHQLLTTTNFGNRSRWFSWYVGGLNYQIEHHLFPTICHVHYRNISSIVKDTATEFGLPYRSVRTFGKALASHGRLLRQLGMRPSMA